MKKEVKKALSQIGIFPGDILTKRPENMSYEEYKKARRENRKQLDNYLHSGKLVHESVIQKRVTSAEGLYIGSVRRTNPQPYINHEKFNMRFERHRRDKRFVEPTEAHCITNPARIKESLKQDWRSL